MKVPCFLSLVVLLSVVTATSSSTSIPISTRSLADNSYSRPRWTGNTTQSGNSTRSVNAAQSVKPKPPVKAPRPTVEIISPNSPPPAFYASVVSVEDGDTIVVVDRNKRSHAIRLAGIDAPERRQAFGNRSRRRLASQVFRKEVTILWTRRDRYGRIVGRVLLNGQDVCLEQIRAGMAWHYKYYEEEQTPEDQKRYAAAEAEARAARRGLWVDKNPIPPWEFRRRQIASLSLNQSKVRPAQRNLSDTSQHI